MHALSLLLPVNSPSCGRLGARLAGGEKKNMLTLSADLEHRIITDMAAVLWQATEARPPIRSSGQMVVVNAECECRAVQLGEKKTTWGPFLSDSSEVLKSY